MKHEELRAFAARLKTLIEAGSALPEEACFNSLALDLFAFQFRHNPALASLCRFRGITPEKVDSWEQIPAVPTSAFKEMEMTCLSPEERQTVFHSSGTTAQKPSRHFHNAETLAAYEASLAPWFARHFRVSEARARPAILSLTPPPDQAPNSSLVHMFKTLIRQFGSDSSGFVGEVDGNQNWRISPDLLRQAAEAAQARQEPVLLLGTAFSFVHLLDLPSLALPAGSAVLETGGYKGKSREIEKPELHRLISRHTAIPGSRIVSEYGMSELSSQAYDKAADGAGERVFHFPPWARAQVISAETGREVPEGGEGLLRVFDLANIGSALAIQTEDLAVRRGPGFQLLGRSPSSEPRGCSLMPA